jgi:tripartite-type tricarboxylate transporter receptor subunit TctC
MCLAFAPIANAQSFPNRPITVIVPFAAGSGSDVASRLIIEQMGKDSKATFVVENRAGANAIIGTQAVINAEPDGYTLLMTGTSSHALAPSLSKSVTYDPIKDFTHIGIATLIPFAIVSSADGKYSDVNQLIADVKSTPGKRTYGYASASNQVVGAKFQSIIGIQARAVPYKGVQDGLTDLYGGRLDYMYVDFVTATNIAKEAGKGKVLLILSEQRSELLPQVPSLKDAGLPSLNKIIGFTGFAGPAGVPAEAQQWFKATLNKALQSPELGTKLRNIAIEPQTIENPESFVLQQLQSWSAAAKEAGLVAQ